MQCQKFLFSLRDDIHYLNNAFKAPLLKSAEAACIQSLHRGRNPIDILPSGFLKVTEEVKVQFAQLINAKSSQVVLMPSVSYGFSTILNNTKAKRNGNAITIKDEFPSGYFSLKKWCKQNDNQLIVVEPTKDRFVGESWNGNILNQITEQTSVVLISSIHWMNGIKFDLDVIGNKCRQVGAKFIVDGTQSVGAMKMDIDRFKIDALVCATYKWLMGPYSVTLAYYGDSYNNGNPLEEAWLNRKNATEFSKLTDYEDEYTAGAGRYNVGQSSNFILMPMLKESLKQILEWNPDNIQKYCHELIQPLMDYLKLVGVELEQKAYFCNHLFSLELPEQVNMEKLKINLLKNNIYISVRGKYLRISVNVFNNSADIAKLIETLEFTAKS